MRHNKALRNIVLYSATALLFQPGAIAIDNGIGSSPQPESARTSAPNQSESINLKGIISIYDGPSPDQLVGGLVTSALEHDKTNQDLQKRDKNMNGSFQKSLRMMKAGARYMTSYSGFEFSSEGADVITEEKLKLKSNSATAYVKQKRLDELHTKVFSNVLQLAQGLGVSEPQEREQIISSGLRSLSDLVGPEDAKAAFESLQSWAKQIKVPEAVFAQHPWSVLNLQEKTEDVLRSSAQADPVMRQVRMALHKYNRHSTAMRVTAKALNMSMSAAMMTPTIISPIAQMIEFVWQQSTGGTEDQKLLKEIYLDKRMVSRWKRLNQESGQAINAYNNALITKNPVLLGFSESCISALGGEETGAKIIGTNKLIARKSTHDDAIDCVQTHGLDM
jgi:hypothetical protein